MKPQDFDIWLKSQIDDLAFAFFLEQIKKRCSDKLKGAMIQGNTDFEKGEVAALNWVLQLPEKLAEPLLEINQ